MLKFAWRWAKVGDKVLVHDRHNLESELIPGVVAFVTRVKHQTSLGIRIVEAGKTSIRWVTPLFVHPDPLDPAETCWICDENNANNRTNDGLTEAAA